MSEAPSLKEVLEHYAHEYCEGWCEQDAGCANFDDCGGCLARRALATLQPSGERREAIARIICYWDEPSTCHDNYCVFSCRAKIPDARFFKAANAILASGLVQNEIKGK